jgi:hypothetical protein
MVSHALQGAIVIYAETKVRVILIFVGNQKAGTTNI